MSQFYTLGGQSIGASASGLSPSNEYSGLISCIIDWFDVLAVQGTLESLLQHHSSKASVLWPSAFFVVQLSHLYVTTGKNHSFGSQDWDVILCLLLHSTGSLMHWVHETQHVPWLHFTETVLISGWLMFLVPNFSIST